MASDFWDSGGIYIRRKCRSIMLYVHCLFYVNKICFGRKERSTYCSVSTETCKSFIIVAIKCVYVRYVSQSKLVVFTQLFKGQLRVRKLWNIKPWFYCTVLMEKGWGTGKVLKVKTTIRRRKKTNIWKKLFPLYFNGPLPLVQIKQRRNSREYKFKHFKFPSTHSHNHV